MVQWLVLVCDPFFCSLRETWPGCFSFSLSNKRVQVPLIPGFSYYIGPVLGIHKVCVQIKIRNLLRLKFKSHTPIQLSPKKPYFDVSNIGSLMNNCLLPYMTSFPFL